MSLAGTALPVGGTWSGAGDATDFTINPTLRAIQRSAVDDADRYSGRFAIAGTALYSTIVVEADLKFASPDDNESRFGPFARYGGTADWLSATLKVDDTTTSLEVVKRVGGTATTLLDTSLAGRVVVDQHTRVRLYVDTSGRWIVWAFSPGASPGTPVSSGLDSVLATGGALAAGKIGVYDAGVAPVD